MALSVPSFFQEWLSAASGPISMAFIPLLLALYRILKKTPRTLNVPKTGERVLILGASSGVGRSMARQYAERGARVCVVGRREAQTREVEQECRAAQASHALKTGKDDILAIPADFTKPGDMVKVREALEAKWNGLDTLVVAAGVSALQPLMVVAGIEVGQGKPTMQQTTKEGIQRAADIASAAISGNYTGPLIAAVTFVPLLSNTSKAPSVILINSLASLIPAPTRTIYASTKASSLLLYQGLSIEHPNINFTCVMPSTIEGDFRASAVDSGPVREADPNQHGMKKEDVARRCIQAADNGEKTVFMPVSMRYAHLLYWVWPGLVEHLARKKYNFKP